VPTRKGRLLCHLELRRTATKKGALPAGRDALPTIEGSPASWTRRLPTRKGALHQFEETTPTRKCAPPGDEYALQRKRRSAIWTTPLPTGQGAVRVGEDALPTRKRTALPIGRTLYKQQEKRSPIESEAFTKKPPTYELSESGSSTASVAAGRIRRRTACPSRWTKSTSSRPRAVGATLESAKSSASPSATDRMPDAAAHGEETLTPIDENAETPM